METSTKINFDCESWYCNLFFGNLNCSSLFWCFVYGFFSMSQSILVLGWIFKYIFNSFVRPFCQSIRTVTAMYLYCLFVIRSSFLTKSIGNMLQNDFEFYLICINNLFGLAHFVFFHIFFHQVRKHWNK